MACGELVKFALVGGTCFLLTMAVNFLLSPVTLVIIVLAQRTLHINVQTLGIILGAGGVGGVLGGIIAPWIRTRVRFGYACIGSVFVWGGATLIAALTSSPGPTVV